MSADAKIAEIMEATQVGMDCITTDLIGGVPPYTLDLYQQGMSCYVTDLTLTPPTITSIFRWTGVRWTKY